MLIDDMLAVGMKKEHSYLLPSPPAVYAGRTPPGATDHIEWINLLRRTLAKIGFHPKQAATVCGHTAKRTMLTWLNASGRIKKDQHQQAAGYHRAKGPGQVSRKYTLHEQAGPSRAIEMMCRDIRQGRSHPEVAPKAGTKGRPDRDDAVKDRLAAKETGCSQRSHAQEPLGSRQRSGRIQQLRPLKMRGRGPCVPHGPWPPGG